MGLSDFFSDLVSSFGLAEAQAEAPPAEQNDEPVAEQQEEKSEEPVEAESESAPAEEEQAEEKTEGEGEAEPEAEAEEEAEEEEEEEEPEEEEPEDIKPKLEEDCANSQQCAPFKHHFDECVERVTRQQEEEDSKGPKEDCVEEFFHLQHCATQCAAPKLWKSLR